MKKWRFKITDVVNVTDVLCAVVYLVVLYGLIKKNGGGSIDMRFWHVVSRLCKRIAWSAGKAGISAEAAYWAAVNRVRA